MVTQQIVAEPAVQLGLPVTPTPPRLSSLAPAPSTHLWVEGGVLSIGRTSRSLRHSLSAHCMGAFHIPWPLLLFPVALVGRRCPGEVPLGQARVPSLPLRRLSLAPVLSPCCLLLLSWTQVPHPVCGAGTQLALGWPGHPGSAQACLLGSFLAFPSDTGLLCSRSRTSCSGMAKLRTTEGIPFFIAISSECGHQLQWTCEAQGMGKLRV